MGYYQGGLCVGRSLKTAADRGQPGSLGPQFTNTSHGKLPSSGRLSALWTTDDHRRFRARWSVAFDAVMSEKDSQLKPNKHSCDYNQLQSW